MENKVNNSVEVKEQQDAQVENNKGGFKKIALIVGGVIAIVGGATAAYFWVKNKKAKADEFEECK